jgi:Lon protease-like protein
MELPPDALAVDADVAEDPARHLYALAARVPLGQADRYAMLAAPTLAARIDVLLDAVDTVAAMVEFQLSDPE